MQICVCLQDLFCFCGFAFLLHVGIFGLYCSRAADFNHGAADKVQRVINVFIASVPTGIATVLIFSLVCF